MIILRQVQEQNNTFDNPPPKVQAFLYKFRLCLIVAVQNVVLNLS